MRLRHLAAAAAAALAIVPPAHAEPMPAGAVVQDLIFFRDVWAAKEKSFAAEARARMLAFVGEQIAHPRAMERWELALVCFEAAAFSGNNHTQPEFFEEAGLFHTLPISFWLFSDGAFVTRAHPGFRRLLGARIVRMGGVPIREAAQRVEKFIAGTPQRKRYEAPAFLTRIEVLRAIGLVGPDGSEVGIEFEMPSGQRVTERLGVAPGADPAAASAPCLASVVPGKGPDPWPHVLDRLSKLPPHVQPPDEFTSLSLAGGRLLYIRSTSLSPYEGENTVQRKAYGIVDEVVKSGKAPDDVVVDLRYNAGGNLFNILNFAVELPKLVGPKGRVYVVTGRATNSAAIVLTALLKANSRGRMTQVGEEPSDDLRFWSEGSFVRAPASKLALRYTDGYHDWAQGCDDLKKCYWPVVLHGVAVGSLHPDLPVDESFADYRDGRDPALDAILSNIRRRRPGTASSDR